MVPPSMPKFVIKKMLTNEICIVFQGIWVQSLIFVTNEKCEILLFDLYLQGLVFDLKAVIFDLKVQSSGLRTRLCACSSVLEPSNVSFLLKGKVLTWSVDLRG